MQHNILRPLSYSLSTSVTICRAVRVHQWEVTVKSSYGNCNSLVKPGNLILHKLMKQEGAEKKGIVLGNNCTS